MLKTLKKTSPVMAGIFALVLTACPGITPPTTTDPGTGSEQASISGTVTKDTGSMANNATVVLIKKEGNVDSDFQIKRTDSNGLYKFTNVPAGNYRVAYVVQSEQERKDKTPIGYSSTGNPSEYFGAITTRNFDYNGDSSTTFQIPAFNVGWRANLSPHDASIDFDRPTTITWGSPNNASSAVDYNVLIKDANDNAFYKSAGGSSTNFTFTPSTTIGNQGSNNGKAMERNKLYYYIVNVTFSDTGSNPSIAYGNTTNGNFTTK